MSVDLRQVKVVLGRREFTATEPTYRVLRELLKHVAAGQAASLAGRESDALDHMVVAIFTALKSAHPELAAGDLEDMPIKPGEVQSAFMAVCEVAGLKQQDSDPKDSAAMSSIGMSTMPISSPPPAGPGSMSTPA
jgi:hypothetical protein